MENIKGQGEGRRRGVKRMLPNLTTSEEDGDRTPPAVQAAVEARRMENEARRMENEARRIEARREQVGQNSTNSSRPPSTDPSGTPPPHRTPMVCSPRRSEA